MVTKLIKIVDKDSPFYTEKGYQEAVLRRNMEIVNNVHEHGLRLQAILKNISKVDISTTLSMERDKGAMERRWSDWTYRNINRFLYSLEKGVPFINTSLKGKITKSSVCVRPHMPLERAVLRNKRLEHYLTLFRELHDKSYSEFIKKAHSVSCEPIKSDLRLKF